MDDLENMIFRMVERAMAGRHNDRMGVVTSYDPDRHAAKVTYQPEGVESGWIPVNTGHIGNGFGIVVGLTPGDQVRVGFQEGDLETGSIIGRVHSDEDKPPKVESGEMLLRHKDGGQIRFAKDKSITFTDAGGGTVHMDGSGKVTITMTEVKIVSGNIEFGAA